MTTALTIDHLYPTRSRRDYVARIVGTDPKYRLGVEFAARDKRNGTHGAILRERGLYESRIWNGEPGEQTPKRYELFDGSRFVGIPNVRELARRVRPGVLERIVETVGARTVDVWDASCSLCDGEVENFTADGWPVCDQHLADVGQPDWVIEVRDTENDSSMEAPF